jgi:hypothetical protein
MKLSKAKKLRKIGKNDLAEIFSGINEFYSIILKALKKGIGEARVLYY